MSTTTMDPSTTTDTLSAGDREGGLLAWQYRLYAGGHHDRTNLLLHAFTAPLFWAGTLALVAALPVALHAPLASIGLAVPGLLALVMAIAIQGRGHAREAQRPVPFRGPLDVVARLFAEQWITFPRFVLSGGFARAWRERSTPQG